MAKKARHAGGTPGAHGTLPTQSVHRGHDATERLSQSLSIQFHFDDVATKSILELCKPSKEWLKQFAPPTLPGESAVTPEAFVVLALEACALRFLRQKVKTISRLEEREYLEKISEHTNALYHLFLGHHGMMGTSSDPFHVQEMIGRDRGDNRTRKDYWAETESHLLMLNTFATLRLRKHFKSANKELPQEKTRRRTDYPRFVLIADLLAAYSRITGKKISAHVGSTKQERKVSPAIDLISVTVPPILQAARLKEPHVLGDELIKKEVASVKRFWSEGSRPELAYQSPDWGQSRSG